MLVLSHALPGTHRDGFGLDRECLRGMLGFGRWVFLSTVAAFATNQGDKLIFAPLIPIGLLGVYNNAALLAGAPGQAVCSLAMAVLFPIFSHRARQGDELPGVFDRVRAPVCALAGVLVAGLIAAGPSFVHLFYQQRFLQADWMVRLLAGAGLLQVLEGTNGAALLALGRSRAVAAYSGAKLVGMAILIPLGYKLGGFPGAVAGLVGSELFKYVASVVAVARAGLSVYRLDLAIMGWTGASAGAAVLAGLWAAVWPTWASFLLEGSVVVALWVPAGLWLWREWKHDGRRTA
jgi:O-antigen/teichoic acid export membrane protein